jgi:hypothetical protein
MNLIKKLFKRRESEVDHQWLAGHRYRLYETSKGEWIWKTDSNQVVATHYSKDMAMIWFGSWFVNHDEIFIKGDPRITCEVVPNG